MGPVCGRQAQAGTAAAQRMMTAASAADCGRPADSASPTALPAAVAPQAAVASLASPWVPLCPVPTALPRPPLLRRQLSPVPSALAVLAVLATSPRLPLDRRPTAQLVTMKRAATGHRRCGTALMLVRPAPRHSLHQLAAGTRMVILAVALAAQPLARAQAHQRRHCRRRCGLALRLELLRCPRLCPLQRMRLHRRQA